MAPEPDKTRCGEQSAVPRARGHSSHIVCAKGGGFCSDQRKTFFIASIAKPFRPERLPDSTDTEPVPAPMSNDGIGSEDAVGE